MSTPETTTLSVQNMTCQGCVRSVTAILSKATGTAREAIDVSLEDARATLPTPSPEALTDAIARLEQQGFPASLAST